LSNSYICDFIAANDVYNQQEEVDLPTPLPVCEATKKWSDST